MTAADVADTTLDLVRDRLVALGGDYTPVDVAAAMRAEGLAVSDSAVLDAVGSLRRHSVGAGPLESLLREPGVTDVLVNGPDQVFIDRGAGLELTDLRFPDESAVRRLAQRLAASVGRRLDDAVPFVDARLADGTGCTPSSAAWHHPGPAYRCACRRCGASRWMTASLRAR
jgi:pilus assembly protein CpaF